LTEIQDDTGDILLGVSPEKCARWALSAWSVEELSGFSGVILVGDDISLKRREKMLLTAGKRSVKANGERSRMYWSSEGGLTQVINIKGHRDPLLAGLQKKRRCCLTRYFWRLKYSSNLKLFLIREIHLGAASAELYRIVSKTRLGTKATKEKYSEIFYSLQLNVGQRLIRSTVLPIAMAFRLYDRLRYGRAK